MNITGFEDRLCNKSSQDAPTCRIIKKRIERVTNNPETKKTTKPRIVLHKRPQDLRLCVL